MNEGTVINTAITCMRICCACTYVMLSVVLTGCAHTLQVWVITGDKQETAINIAISCKLIRHPDSLLICNADSSEAAKRRIDELSGQIRKMRGEPERPQTSYEAPPRKKGFFARFAHLNPFEDEEANPKHQQNLHLTVAKVGEHA